MGVKPQQARLIHRRQAEFKARAAAQSTGFLGWQLAAYASEHLAVIAVLKLNLQPGIVQSSGAKVTHPYIAAHPAGECTVIERRVQEAHRVAVPAPISFRPLEAIEIVH